MKLFTMEKELRIIKNRGHFLVPQITPQSTKIEKNKDVDKVLEAVDREVTEMITAVRESEQIYEKEKLAARNTEQQVILARQTNGSEFTFPKINSSTPIRKNKTAPQLRTNQQAEAAVHFDPNTIRHYYPMTDPTGCGDRYEPRANNSIIQGADSASRNQFETNTISVTSCNEQWRYNNGTNTAARTGHQTRTTRQSSCNGSHNNLPNSSDNRNGSTCFRCGEQGHMRIECSKDRVFCSHCRTPNHDAKACRQHHNSTPY